MTTFAYPAYPTSTRLLLLSTNKTNSSVNINLRRISLLIISEIFLICDLKRNNLAKQTIAEPEALEMSLRHLEQEYQKGNSKYRDLSKKCEDVESEIRVIGVSIEEAKNFVISTGSVPVDLRAVAAFDGKDIVS